MYQRNLNTKRFTPAPAQKESNWYVTIPGRFLPATYKYSLDSRSYSISLVAKDIKAADKGGSGRRDVLHFRGSSPQELKERIEAAFFNAVFSSEQPKEADPVKAAYQEERDNAPADAKEIANAREKLRKQYGQRNANGVQELIPGTKFTEEDCRKVGIRRGVFWALSRQAEQDEINLLTNAARQLVAEQTPEQQEKWLGAHLQDFVDNGYTDHPEWGWKEFFRARPRFFQWPDNTGWNRNQLLKYCRAHGSGYIPTILELCQGMKFLLDRGKFFAMKETYERSKQFERDALQEYRGDEYVPPAFSDRQIQEATKQLGALMPAGMRPSDEFVARAAKQLGISDELLFAIQNPGEQVKAQLGNKSSLELKRNLAAMRPPVEPARRRRGY